MDCPELIPELARRIEAVRRVNRLLVPESPDAGKPAQQVSPDGPTLTQQWQVDSAVPTGDTPFARSATPVTGGGRSDDPKDGRRQLGAYRLLKLLGSGGMGEVYLAEDAVLTRQVALKVMKPEVAVRPEFRERFLREARSAAGLQHDHIVPIYHVGDDAGIPYIAMPLLQGESLEDRLRREARFPVAEVVRIGREAAQGLAAAHAAGLVHRDIKPANLWLEAPDGRVKVLDFGLARAATADGLTQTGIILGTPQYMAPEQIDGLPVDGRTDLFSLGCVLYRLATGELPFQGPTLTAVLRAVAASHPLAPRVLRPELPLALSDLIERLLAKDPKQRPASAREVADALRTIDAKSGISMAATPSTLLRPTAAPRRRRWSWTFKISLTITISFGLLFAVGLYQLEKARDDVDSASAIAVLDGPPPRLPVDLNARSGTGAFPKVAASKAAESPPGAATNLGTNTSPRAPTESVTPTGSSVPLGSGQTGPPVTLPSALALQQRLDAELDELLRQGNYSGAAARVRVADAAGAGAAWVTAQDDRIRAAWRQAAGALPTTEAQLVAYQALLQRYPTDSAALALVTPLRARLMTRERNEAEVQQLLSRGDFHGAAELVRAAIAGGSDRAWATARHGQVRDAWRTAAGAKPAEEDRLKEFEALLKDYTGDPGAMASADKLRTTIRLQEQSIGEIEKLLTGRTFAGAATKVRSAVSGGASEAWAIRQNDLVRKAWRAAAEAKRTTEEQLNELQSLLVKFPNDADATALLYRLRDNLARLEIVVKDVDRHLVDRKFHDAVAAVKVAVKGGASQAWATEQDERIRAKWREAAGAKATDQARLLELDNLLKEYPADAAAKAQVAMLANRLTLQKEVGEEVDRLLGQSDFKAAAACVRAAAAQGAGGSWADARQEQVRQAWRQRAAAKATDEERLIELEALLKEYPGDAVTMAARDAIFKNFVAFRELDLGNTVKLRLVEIKPPAGGTFPMGSPNNEPERDTPSERLQQMALPRGYLLGETEVTVGQFRRFIEDSKYKPKGSTMTPPLDWANPFSRVKQTDDHPVVGVTWSDAVAFCEWLSQKTGRKCRLPYETEWEYACRAGTTTPFSFGPKLSKDKAAFNCATPDPEAKLLDGPGSAAPTSTVPVRKYPANAWGLYGMHGNAAEWCADAYQSVPQPPGQAAQAKDAGDGVARGGGWKSTVEDCRSAYRWKRTNNAVAKDDIGFRICVDR